MAKVSEAAYVGAVAAAQGIMAFADSSLKVDGKWGRFTQAAYERQPGDKRRQIDKLVFALTSGGTVLDLVAYRDAQRVLGAGMQETALKLSDEQARTRELVKAIANKEGVPVETAMKIAHLESRFRPNATSPTGAAGVFQMTGVAITDVNRLYGTSYTKKDMYDPIMGITAGVRYIKIVGRYMNVPLTDTVKIYMGFNIGVGSARKVLAGNPEGASKEINQQAYGPPAVYAARLANAVQNAPVV